jgi:hypothetical protein
MRLLRCATAAALLLTMLSTAGVGQGPNVPASLAAGQRADLVAFERDFFAVDRAYSPEARAQARRRLDALTTNAGKISDARFVLELSQIIALADNGHTMMLYRGNVEGLGRVGVRLAPFGRDFFVLHAVAQHADLLGGRLVAIDGVPIAQLRDSAHTLAGGIPAWRDRRGLPFLESPGALHALGITKSAATATYRFQMRDDSSREASLAAVPDPFGGAEPDAVLAPGAGPSGWRTLLPADKAPWSLQESGETMRRRDAPEMDAMVIQLRANVDGRIPIATFLEESDAARRTAGRKNVVLDMRMNDGGDLQLTRAWMSSITSRLPPGGRVVILTSPWTFSAAISSTAYLKQAGGARVVLVGEAPGDRLRFWAEGRPISLPHSGALILMATQRHDYLTGCEGFTDCHPYVAKYSIAIKSLDPDVAAPWTLENYAAGRDPGMEAAARVLAKRN